MTKPYLALLDECLPNATPEQKDEALEKIRAFLNALFELHVSVQSRDKNGKSASVTHI